MDMGNAKKVNAAVTLDTLDLAARKWTYLAMPLVLEREFATTENALVHLDTRESCVRSPYQIDTVR